MSSYHSSFTYLGKNSASDFNWIISHFDADNGESETGLATESIYTASSDGTSRNLYGTKYSGAAPVRITVIKQDGGDWTIGDNRLALKWLTGAKSDSWLDLYIGDEVKYRMLGHIQNVLQYKIDARIVGLVIVFESASPFAFSTLQTVTVDVWGKKTFSIDNPSDDVYTFVKMKTTYANTVDAIATDVEIENTTTSEITRITNLAAGEVVTLNNNQIIVSDKPSRIFGNDFNFNFPRLAPGVNEFTITGIGSATFEYSYFIKIGDMATEINAVSDRICDDFGNIQLDMLDWSRISNTPTTVGGYGIVDVYTNTQVDGLINDVHATFEEFINTDYVPAIQNLENRKADQSTTIEGYGITDAYTKTEIDNMLDNISIPSIDTYTKAEIDQKFAKIDVSNLDTYTKAQIDDKLNNIVASGVDISEEELNNMLAEVLGE